jgi:hypothetical protein|tara:strand:- start:140 stop:331 length:192 start_codon:yes stop_codon:yes gene_type:complete
MLKGQEYSLLEPCDRDDITHTVVSVQQSLFFAEGQPHDEAALFAVSLITLTNHVQEGLLGLSQ